jgi:hypothetical protein
MTRFVEEIEIHRHIARQCEYKNWPKAASAASVMMSVRLHLAFQICLSLSRMNWSQAIVFARVLISSAKLRPSNPPYVPK